MMHLTMKFSLFSGSYTASFPPVASIATIALCLALIQLGQWQQHRAQWKTRYLQRQAALSTQAPLSLTALWSRPPQDVHLLPLQLRGHFDNQHTLLLDNRFRQHRAGFEVLTPFWDETARQWVLVNRGWVPSAPTHRLEKPIVPISGTSTITGYGYVPGKEGLVIGKNLTETQPPLIQQIRLTELGHRFHRTFLPFTLRLNPSLPTDYDRHWTLITLSPARHRAYAFQWYALAATLIIAFFATRIKRCQ